MCEWCPRLVMRNYKWDHHADFRGMMFMFNYTQKSIWYKDKWTRKDWRRALTWCEDHSLNYEDIGRREWKRARGVGGRYWSSYD